MTLKIREKQRFLMIVTKQTVGGLAESLRASLNKMKE